MEQSAQPLPREIMGYQQNKNSKPTTFPTGEMRDTMLALLREVIDAYKNLAITEKGNVQLPLDNQKLSEFLDLISNLSMNALLWQTTCQEILESEIKNGRFYTQGDRRLN